MLRALGVEARAGQERDASLLEQPFRQRLGSDQRPETPGNMLTRPAAPGTRSGGTHSVWRHQLATLAELLDHRRDAVLRAGEDGDPGGLTKPGTRETGLVIRRLNGSTSAAGTGAHPHRQPIIA